MGMLEKLKCVIGKHQFKTVWKGHAVAPVDSRTGGVLRNVKRSYFPVSGRWQVDRCVICRIERQTPRSLVDAM